MPTLTFGEQAENHRGMGLEYLLSRQGKNDVELERAYS